MSLRHLGKGTLQTPPDRMCKIKVRNATSNDSIEPSHDQIQEIAQLSSNILNCPAFQIASSPHPLEKHHYTDKDLIDRGTEIRQKAVVVINLLLGGPDEDIRNDFRTGQVAVTDQLDQLTPDFTAREHGGHRRLLRTPEYLAEYKQKQPEMTSTVQGKENPEDDFY